MTGEYGVDASLLLLLHLIHQLDHLIAHKAEGIRLKIS